MSPNAKRVLFIIGIAVVSALAVGARAGSINSAPSGITGQAIINSTCSDAATQCAKKPYQTTFTVYLPNSKTYITSFNTDLDGKFKVSLTPGTYSLQAATNNTYRYVGPTVVDVSSGKFTSVNLSFESQPSK